MIDLKVRIKKEIDGSLFMDMYVNGGIVSGACGMTIRVTEIVAFLLKVSPDNILIDREGVSDDLLFRLRGFKTSLV